MAAEYVYKKRGEHLRDALNQLSNRIFNLSLYADEIYIEAPFYQGILDKNYSYYKHLRDLSNIYTPERSEITQHAAVLSLFVGSKDYFDTNINSTEKGYFDNFFLNIKKLSDIGVLKMYCPGTCGIYGQTINNLFKMANKDGKFEEFSVNEMEFWIADEISRGVGSVGVVDGMEDKSYFNPEIGRGIDMKVIPGLFDADLAFLDMDIDGIVEARENYSKEFSHFKSVLREWFVLIEENYDAENFRIAVEEDVVFRLKKMFEDAKSEISRKNIVSINQEEIVMRAIGGVLSPKSLAKIPVEILFKKIRKIKSPSNFLITVSKKKDRAWIY